MIELSEDDIRETGQMVLFICRMTFRVLAVLLLTLYVTLMIFVNAPHVHAATLIPQVAVSSDQVHLSDLFSDLDAHQDAVLGAAPQPGKTMVIGSRTLTRVAGLYNVDWQATSPLDQVVVTRDVQTIAPELIKDAIKSALKAKGVTGEFNVSLGGLPPAITLGGEVPATVEVAQMNFTSGRDVFSATLAAPSAANPLKTVSVSGVIEKSQEIPVLKSMLKNGDVIGAADIEWMSVTTKNMVYDTLTDVDQLIGKTPVRALQAGEAVRKRDLISPQLVARGDEVIIEFVNGTMALSVKGKAMQPGAEGELIRVVNLSSNQSLRAEVVGDRMVRVQ